MPNKIENFEDLVKQIELTIPSCAIVVSVALNNAVSSYYKGESESDCSAEGELYWRIVFFVSLIIFAALTAFWHKTSVAYNCVVAVSILAWILTTSADYLVCFISGGDTVSDGTMRNINIGTAVITIIWGGFLGAVRAQNNLPNANEFIVLIQNMW